MTVAVIYKIKIKSNKKYTFFEISRFFFWNSPHA